MTLSFTDYFLKYLYSHRNKELCNLKIIAHVNLQDCDFIKKN